LSIGPCVYPFWIQKLSDLKKAILDQIICGGSVLELKILDQASSAAFLDQENRKE
jgi:hypothetical protein